MDGLKFIALDAEDLAVVSAHVQDAEVIVRDVIWRPQEHRLIMALARFDWLAAATEPPQLRRCRSALRFERVVSLKGRNIDPAARDLQLNLLAVEFHETDAPGGIVTLLFEDDVTLRLEVECLEAELADLGEAWTVNARPDHPEIQDDLAAP
ncbi:MAG TPA: DUF2948 family protein [Xanthobacteraceae bacterium]|nr:DUF2948 family protein [Xanthobacteraceae bacterium]